MANNHGRLRRGRASRLTRRGAALPLPGRRNRAERGAGVSTVPAHDQRPPHRAHRRHAGLDDELISAWTAGRQAGARIREGRPRLVQAVRRARATSDTLIVFLHWGVELQQCSLRISARWRSGSSRRRRRRRRWPRHRVQGAGRLGKALVGYGLGNRLVRDERLRPDRRSARHGRRTEGPRLPLGARAHRRRNAPALVGSERRAQIASWRSLRGALA